MSQKAQEGNQHTWFTSAIKSETKENNQHICEHCNQKQTNGDTNS